MTAIAPRGEKTGELSNFLHGKQGVAYDYHILRREARKSFACREALSSVKTVDGNRGCAISLLFVPGGNNPDCFTLSLPDVPCGRRAPEGSVQATGLKKRIPRSSPPPVSSATNSSSTANPRTHGSGRAAVEGSNPCLFETAPRSEEIFGSGNHRIVEFQIKNEIAMPPSFIVNQLTLISQCQ